MNENNLTMIQTTSGTRFLYEGTPINCEDPSDGPLKLDGSRLYVFDQVLTPQGELVTKPTRFDNTPFAPDGPVTINSVESWWKLSEKSDLHRKFRELKDIQSAKKAGLVLA